jgi:alkylhydroperoxidase/carboxymuconolactone decarboxylase family protein YurZ
VEEVLHLGASDGEIAEALDVGVLMGGTLSMKSVRHAFAAMEAVRSGGA